jgi:hypothetical protein
MPEIILIKALITLVVGYIILNRIIEYMDK